jgi:ATP-dependent RNA helicase DeaD
MITDSTHPFSSFGLSPEILEALTRKGFSAPSSIQTIALPRLLADQGHLIVKARTGTGKTAAFGIPLVERLTQGGQNPRALILTPTRELALQVSKEIASFVTGPFPRIAAVYGGASIRNQILDLKRGAEIVVGTPGRIMDLMDRKVLNLSSIEWFILDEADEMLDMGFFEDVEKIMGAVKPERRVALFSATMPDAILRIVREHIGETEILEDSAPEDEKPAVDQFYMILKKEDRLEALRRLIDSAPEFYGLIFCATKIGADELARRLTEGGYSAEAIHGDLSQEARERTLRRFRARRATNSGEISILVATDVAARGLDIERLTHVINWDLPNDRETYIHRIGRTGRAGRRGMAVSLALPSDRGRLSQLSRSMERTLGSRLELMKVPPVKSVMKALQGRILTSILAAIPPREPEAGPEPLPAGGPAAEGFSGAADQGPPAELAAAQPPDMPEVSVAEAPDMSAAEVRDTPEVPAAAWEEAKAPEEPVLTPIAQTRLGRKLMERLGPEGAVEALIAVSYGELLDPSRYGPITELSGIAGHEAEPGRAKGRRPRALGGFEERRPRGLGFDERRPSRASGFEERRAPAGSHLSRVYVGLGRRHGASARDVAELLTRAAGVPGRLVDAIELKDYCAFATLPEEAARRACTFSRKSQDDPVIRPASPQDRGPRSR